MSKRKIERGWERMRGRERKHRESEVCLDKADERQHCDDPHYTRPSRKTPLDAARSTGHRLSLTLSGVERTYSN